MPKFVKRPIPKADPDRLARVIAEHILEAHGRPEACLSSEGWYVGLSERILAVGGLGSARIDVAEINRGWDLYQAGTPSRQLQPLAPERNRGRLNRGTSEPFEE